MTETTLIALVIAIGIVAAAFIVRSGNKKGALPMQTAQPTIDIEALTASIRTSVEAQVRQTVSESQRTADESAKRFFDAQAKTLEEQTKNILMPFQNQVKNLSESVTTLRDSYTNERGLMEGLTQQITTLQHSTTSLSNALKSPTARGSWGENQLRNVIQLAGMEPYCDYVEQFTGGEAERQQRPDVVVRLPNGASLVVDSKAPLSAYLRMQEATDTATKEIELKNHVKAIAEHAKTLAAKKYWEQFPAAPDFVIMFIPGESFVSDALRAAPNLLEESMRSRVLIASPVNLLAVLLAVAKGWQAHSVAEHAERVAKLGNDLYDRVGTVLEKVNKMGNGLKSANSAYNDMVGSMESRMLVTLRQFKDLGVVSGDEIDEIKSLEAAPRQLNAPELPRELES
jgi:DNA recombination protein RmuC